MQQVASPILAKVRRYGLPSMSLGPGDEDAETFRGLLFWGGRACDGAVVQTVFFLFRMRGSRDGFLEAIGLTSRHAHRSRLR